MRTNQHVYGERAFWVKGQEAKMVGQKSLTVILREGDRSDQVVAPKQWLPLFEAIPVYFLDEVAAKGGPLGFEPDDGMTVRVVRRTVGRLGDLKDADLSFGGGTAVPRTVAEVQRYLSEEYAPGKTFLSDTIFTVYWVEYLPNEPCAAD